VDPPEIGALPSAAAVLGEGAPRGKCPSTDVPKAVSDDVMRSAPMRAQFFNTRDGSSTTGAKYRNLPKGRVENEASAADDHHLGDEDGPAPEPTVIGIIDGRSDARCASSTWPSWPASSSAT
jgi:hypothetical protein